MHETQVLRLMLLSVGAALWAFGSSVIERHGPDYGIYCALGTIEGVDVLCPKLKLNGGWPAPYLFDTPGVSREGRLAFVEDEFRPWPFVADLSFYLLLLLAFDRAARRRLPRLSRRRSG